MFGSARLVLHSRFVGCLALVAALSACGGRQQPKNLLIVTLDTLRADRVGAYGYAAAQTPTLDALAARGARFSNATTTTPLTLSAHTSLFTGTLPTYHGVRDNTGFYVDDSLQTLAETLKARGYRTGGFVGAFVLDSRWGIAQGFDTYVDDFDLSAVDTPDLGVIQRRGGDVVDRALAWLKDAPEQAFFGWIHLYDPHWPYDAPTEFASRFPTSRDGAYDAEVAYADAQLGRLLTALDVDGRRDETLVVVLADHGEQLGEHGEESHGFFVYDASVRIPLVVAGPGVAPRVVRDQVRIVDVMPTVLDLVGVEVPAPVQGTSLRPALGGEAMSLQAYSESWYPRLHYGWSELTAIRDGRFKFILAPTRELYDVEADPGETSNLAATSGARADAMERLARQAMAQSPRAARSPTPATVDPAAEQRLRALGYVTGTSAKNLEDRPRRDPKDVISLYNLLLQAGQDSELGRYDDAATKVRRALAEDPDIIEAHMRLGNILAKADRHVDAVQAFQRALALDPEHVQSTFNLSLAYRALGRLPDAVVGFQRAQQLDPRSGRAHFQLGDIYMQQGQPAKALEVLTAGLALDVDRPAFLVKVAEAHLELRQFDAAEKSLREAIALRPGVRRGQYNLALVAEQRGNLDGARAAYEAEAAAHPKNYGAQFNLGKILMKEGRLADATTRFRAAVDAQPEFAEGYLYLAKALLDGGQLPAAERTARAGLAKQPDRSIAPLGHYVLADVYSRMGRENEAAREVARARALERGR